MFFTGATVAGAANVPNEDWTAATSDLVVMLDGATIRTETGCRHGAAWYTRKLGASIIANAATRSHPLDQVLSDAIREVAALHPECNLTHPGTPSAAAAIVRLEGDLLRYLVLGDVTIVLDSITGGVITFSDQRVSDTAAAERAAADAHLIGTAEKASALVAMKHAELEARNRPGGYWVAAADPTAVEHAITGEATISTVRRLAVLTDGAARSVEMFRLEPWDATLNTIANYGPLAFIHQIRAVESRDPLGAVYRRNKASDDATVVFAELTPRMTKRHRQAYDSRTELTLEQRQALAGELLSKTLNAPGIYGDGNSNYSLRRPDAPVH
jgi:Protein phosphatase 2C